MKPEIEIYAMKFYRRPYGEGWRLAFFEVENFDTGASWSLMTFDWLNKHFTFTWL